MRKSGLVAGVALIALAAAALGIGRLVKHRRNQPVAKPIAPVSTIFQGLEVTLTGRLQAQKIESVDAPVTGILDAWFVDVGQEVYEKQLVGRIRNADLDNAVQQAQSALDRAEIRIAQFDAQIVNARLEVSRTTADQIRARNELDRIEKIYQRYKNLMDAGAIARLTFEKTEAEYAAAKIDAANRERSAKEAQDKAAAMRQDSEEAKKALAEQTAALARAKDVVAECDLHSPADGVVVTRAVHQGDQVEKSAKGIISIATQLTKLTVVVTPDPSVLVRIRAGQHAIVRIGDKESPGDVKEVRGTGVLVEFTNEKPVTTLGSAAQVRIVF